MNRPLRFRFNVVILITFCLLLLHGCAGKSAALKAEKFIRENNYDAAVEEYSKALQKHPDDIDLNIRFKSAKQKASLEHMTKAEKLISKKYYREAIEELQMAIAFYSSNHRAVELVDKVKMKKESEYLVQKGIRLVKTGRFEKARIEFEKAVELDPENGDAVSALEKFKKKESEISKYPLKLTSNTPVSLKFKKTPVVNVFEILSKLFGINFIFDKDIKETKVTLFMTDVSFDRFLDVLLKANELKAKMIDDKTMLIYQDTPQKAKAYDELYVKTFYLSYLEAKSAVAILTRIMKSKDVIANDKLNAVTVRGPRENVEMAARIIEANDRTPSEVILNVEILEVARNKEKELGLSISETITFGISETSSGIEFDSGLGFAGMASIKDLSKITSKELYLSLPTATLNLLKKDGDTRTLAKPQVRVSSSEKASILIGEKVPLRSNRKVQTDGTTTYDYQYQDVGVKLDVEPVINMYNQVSLKMTIEISTLGANVGTVNDPQYSIKTRAADTSLTINDGDSVIIGGLIADEDRTSMQKIPFLGDVPVLGRLFSTENANVIKKDILMTITPVIIRNQDLPEVEISEFWSGNEIEAALKEPVEEKLIQENNFNDIPAQDFITVARDDVFLPSDNYFSIQVFSAVQETDAQNKSGKLKELGYDTWVRPGTIDGKGTFYRVYVGQYDSYQKAENARQEMFKRKIFTRDIHIVDRAYVYGK